MKYFIKKGDTQATSYDVSIIFLMYNQSIEKIMLSLASVMRQKDVVMQIVIADDGSKDPHMQECIDYMEKCNFSDYIFIFHKSNVGTVKNYFDAIQFAKGLYVKDLGPGDCFNGDYCLENWVKKIKKEKSQMSFCNSIYYKKNVLGYHSIIEVAHPQYPGIYAKKSQLQKRYYLLFNDIFLGASILGKREVLIKYFERMYDMIKYAEDNIYRVMILEGVSFSYYSHNAIFYEWGDGVSTHENEEFKNALTRDWEKTTEYICKCCKNNYADRLIKCYYQRGGEKITVKERLFKYLAEIYVYIHNVHNKGLKRLTCEENLDYLYKLEKEYKSVLLR